MSTHTPAHMSPAQAAQVADVSRWTIMRAIKSGDLQAFRDNKNQWKIKSDDLNTWLSDHPAQGAHPVQDKVNAHPDPIAEDTLELARVKAELEAEKTLRASIETDRDHWRELAQKLTEKRPRKWWFWR